MTQHSAKHLIIGGGIIGCSIAYHLTRMGERDVVLLERAGLTEGATWHAAGLVGQLRSSRNTTRMLKKSVEMYDRLQNEEGMQFDWKKTGSLRLAATRERLLEARRLATMARSFDLEMQIVSPGEAKDLFPLIEARGLEGAAFIPSDGYVDPASLCQAVAGSFAIRERIRVSVCVSSARSSEPPSYRPWNCARWSSIQPKPRPGSNPSPYIRIA